MEILLLIISLAIEALLLYLGYTRRGMMLYFFSGIIGLVVCLTLVGSGNQITYTGNSYYVVTNATSGAGFYVLQTIDAGPFFFLIPVLLTIIAFVGVSTLRTGP